MVDMFGMKKILGVAMCGAWLCAMALFAQTADFSKVPLRDVTNWLQVKGALKAKPASIKSLSLANRGLQDIPAWVFEKLPNLENLNVQGNQLKALPAKLSKLRKLKVLDVRNNQISDVHGNIGALSKLEILKLTKNKLSALPASLWRLPNLKALHVSLNYLDALPEDVRRLKKLEYLGLQGNELKGLPQGIGDLSRLKTLSLSDNPLTSLPPDVMKLRQQIQSFGLKDVPSLRYKDGDGSLGKASLKHFFGDRLKI